ncbi:hypothetical protein ACIQNG_06115 [Streptomyces sp. NPDC091377]|uniref:hypothetical protein n=1 Tax=Streptomyces sp. NPDC091377 TaxID=3365995 RepID=UPI0037F1756D
MRIRKLMATTLAGGALTAGLAMATATPATADGNTAFETDCSPGEVCLHYNSSAYGYGAVLVQYGWYSDYAGYTFRAGKNGSAGAGVDVKNNAAAVDSFTGSTFRVFYNSGYNCNVACQDIPPYYTRDLNSTMKNQNASGRTI